MTGPTYTRALGLARLAAIYLLVALLLAPARPVPLGLALGSTLVALGLALRLWASGHLVKNLRLVTSGPYRYTRNPLYLGRLLVFTGLCVMARLPFAANWLALAAGYLVFFGYYLPRKERVEPTRLLELHGEAFERYRREVPALWPSPRPYVGAAPGNWSVARVLANREYWMPVALALVILFLYSRT